MARILDTARTVAALYPELAAQWHSRNELTPEEVAGGSNKKFWWKCAEGHEWEASPNSRSGGRGCAVCSGRKLLSGYNDLATRYPDVALQWHPSKNEISAQEVMPKSNKNYWWQCPFGHEWETTPNARTVGNGCPECIGRVLKPGVNDLATINPELAVQWHPTKNAELTPNQVFPSSNRKVWWECSEGHEWDAAVNNRAQGSGCPVCAGRVATATRNLAVLHPTLAAQWHPTKNGIVQATDVLAGSWVSAWWQCDLEHEWQAFVYSRMAGNGCPVCAGKATLAGFNDLLSLHPEIAAQWHPSRNKELQPDEVVQFSNKRVWWVCELGHEWIVSVAARTNGSQCPICSGQQVLSGFNDLVTLNPVLASQWNLLQNGDLNSSMVTIHSNKVVVWQCVNGHKWSATVSTRSKGHGCARCSGSGPSLPEQALGDWLENLGLEVVRNSRSIIKPYELDIFLPKYNFAIEFNGLYWHSEAMGKGRNYHKGKVEASGEEKITLFQVWEDDWKDRQAIIKRMILHRLGLNKEPVIFARRAKIVELNTSQAQSFLEANHLQGRASGSLYLGLEYQGAVVAVMVLKRMIGNVIYLERYATSVRIPGGFTRLLKQAIKRLSPSKIITFADRSISNGELYEKNGFRVDSVLPPDYSYLVRDARVHKFNYRLKRFRNDPTLQFIEGMSESQLASLNKLHRIWDSGKIRYVLEP